MNAIETFGKARFKIKSHLLKVTYKSLLFIEIKRSILEMRDNVPA